MDMNALLAMAAKMNEEKKGKFEPLALTVGNVVPLFNRCLADPDTKRIADAILFPTTRGWKIEDLVIIEFDTEKLLKDKKSIKYMLGQLEAVHSGNDRKFRVNLDDYNTTYLGEHWAKVKGDILKFCYLSVTCETNYITPFHAATNTSLISPEITPTLSPKDPNFPAWWEEHKAEWETA